MIATDYFASIEPSRTRTIRWHGSLMKLEFPPIAFLLRVLRGWETRPINCLMAAIEIDGEFFPFRFYNVNCSGIVCMPMGFDHGDFDLETSRDLFWNSDFDNSYGMSMPIVNDNICRWRDKTQEDPGFMKNGFNPGHYLESLKRSPSWRGNNPRLRFIRLCLDRGGFFSNSLSNGAGSWNIPASQ